MATGARHLQRGRYPGAAPGGQPAALYRCSSRWQTGYVRDRPAEFARRDVPRSELLRRDRSGSRRGGGGTLRRSSSPTSTPSIPETIAGSRVTTGDYLIHLATHFAYHLGQIDYHRRVVTGRRRGGGRGPAVGTELGAMIFFLLLALAAGVLLPVQAGLNAQLRSALGSPVAAALISFLVGTAGLARSRCSARAAAAGTRVGRHQSVAVERGPHRRGLRARRRRAGPEARCSHTRCGGGGRANAELARAGSIRARRVPGPLADAGRASWAPPWSSPASS